MNSSDTAETLADEIRGLMRDGTPRTTEEIFDACTMAITKDQVSKTIYALRKSGYIETPEGQQPPAKHSATERLLNKPQASEEAKPKPAPGYSPPVRPAWIEALFEAHRLADQALSQYLENLDDPVLSALRANVKTLETLLRSAT